jgi:SpoIID/LytB domain protein
VQRFIEGKLRLRIDAHRGDPIDEPQHREGKAESPHDGEGERVWDVRDDTSDQCYGGHSRETERTNAVVLATAGQFLVYDGQPIRAMYAGAHGGASENPGCVFNAIRVGGTWGCAEGWPYLTVVPDPAELAAYDKRGANPEDELWSEHFSGPEIRAQITDYGATSGSSCRWGSTRARAAARSRS